MANGSLRLPPHCRLGRFNSLVAEAINLLILRWTLKDWQRLAIERYQRQVSASLREDKYTNPEKARTGSSFVCGKVPLGFAAR